ncbi:hypothetical protein LTR94_034283, partial [Friedmanniomyces endolithicus]
RSGYRILRLRHSALARPVAGARRGRCDHDRLDGQRRRSGDPNGGSGVGHLLGRRCGLGDLPDPAHAIRPALARRRIRLPAFGSGVARGHADRPPHRHEHLSDRAHHLELRHYCGPV